MLVIPTKKSFTLKKCLLCTNSAQQIAQLTFTCSKSIKETLEKDVKYVQS